MTETSYAAGKICKRYLLYSCVLSLVMVHPGGCMVARGVTEEYINCKYYCIIHHHYSSCLKLIKNMLLISHYNAKMYFFRAPELFTLYIFYLEAYTRYIKQCFPANHTNYTPYYLILILHYGN